MFLSSCETCLVYSACTKVVEVRETLTTVKLGMCKKLHSILYSHWDPKTDWAVSRAIETNGTSILECCWTPGLCWCFFWVQYSCLRAVLSEWVCVHVFDILGTGGERGQSAASLSHIVGRSRIVGSSLLFTGVGAHTPGPRPHPRYLLWYMHLSFTVCPKTNNVSFGSKIEDKAI